MTANGSYVTLKVEAQVAADIVAVIGSLRRVCPPEDAEYDARLRDVSLAMVASLRSVGWKPNGDGGWMIEEARRGR